MEKLALKPIGRRNNKTMLSGSHREEYFDTDVNMGNVIEIIAEPPGPVGAANVLQSKRKNSSIGIEKWFPIGSKGRDIAQIKMVAQ